MTAQVFDTFKVGAPAHQKQPLTCSNDQKQKNGAPVRQRCAGAPKTPTDQPIHVSVRR